MEQYIKKSALVAEIERLIDEIYVGRPFDALSSGQQTALWYIKSIMSSINTLEVKEMDLKLTLEDVSMIRQIMFDYHRQIRNEMSIPNDEEYCKEVLKRFRAQKGE